MLENFDDIKVGDEVRVNRGRSPDSIRKVTHVTAKTFDVVGYGKFWKKNGKGYGDADSWYAAYASHIQKGDRERIERERARRINRQLVNGFPVEHYNDDELARVAAIVTEAIKRRQGDDNDDQL